MKSRGEHREALPKAKIIGNLPQNVRISNEHMKTKLKKEMTATDLDHIMIYASKKTFTESKTRC